MTIPPISPESRAEDIDLRALNFIEGQIVGESANGTIVEDARRLTRLLREAENAAYERAAQVAENDRAKCQANAFTLRHVSEARHDLWLACADTGLKIADAILSLRHKDTP